MDALPLEIERKYLIRYPDPEELKRRSHARRQITQTYLKRPSPDAPGVRLRLMVTDGEIRYIRTEKTRLTNMTRVEIETDLTKEEYEAGLRDADPSLRIIRKDRWCVSFGGKVFEIDLFPFWQDRALLEIELESEDSPFALPDFIHVIREVTDDPRYTNLAIAREIPDEQI
ncbi:MAG: hypothetical protein IJC35_00930 [Oscillospiraceae bacterium]|nr:hypothetical protein [Oscillospiraceae bacterium]